ncbi:peptidoglycan D,D-transpeptidase FtsI family protein [Kallotenue papyrolyticum]|uniref:peptidoglycan D,D-transpeptidase FtsI family protein n=1 Tax=Kallotenue papyrolyticum TaxID=1325125 RepID=UPI000478569A|nr:penicillin-binding transpeptidase domain-containing protein [Kallotenue papyrolyticum]
MAQISASQPKPITRARINVLLLCSTLLAVLVLQQLIQIQVRRELRGRRLDELAQRELTRHEVLQPRRGTIYDRDGVALAMNVNRPSLYVDSSKVREPAKLALLLAPLIGRDAGELQPILMDKTREWTRLARWVSDDAARQIEQLQQDKELGAGLWLIPEAQRVYPRGEFAARVVGAANYEGVGIAGVEAFYDSEIRGVTGTLRAERSGSLDQQPIWIAPQQIIEPQDGIDLKLTIDSTVQKIVEDELRASVEYQQAEGGTIIVMDPATGEILGMAAWPPFDPNRYTQYPPEVVNRNNALTDVYEPGSTFKVLLTAIGLQVGAFTTETRVNDTGVVHRYGWDIGNWNRVGNGAITPGEMLYHSSNVGALLFGEMIGRERFYDYVKLLGYGQPTGIDLGGEGTGIVRWPEELGDQWSDLYLDQNSFGQGIAVTPIQHITAIAAVANGGTLMWPHVVREKCQGEQCTPVQPRVIRRVFDQAVTDAVRQMLVRNSENYGAFFWYTNGNAYFDQPLVPGYRVAAKTGTSQISLGAAGYDNNAVIGSVVGFAPAEQPRIAVLVKIDRPKKAAYGIEAAIPVYQHIVSKLMTHFRIPPDPHYVAEGQTIGGP